MVTVSSVGMLHIATTYIDFNDKHDSTKVEHVQLSVHDVHGNPHGPLQLHGGEAGL